MLGRVEQVHRRHRAGGVGGHRRQDALQPPDQRPDAVRVEHVGAELDPPADPGGLVAVGPAFGQREHQVHAGHLGVQRDRGDPHVAQGQPGPGVAVLAGEVLPGQHHLHERVMAQAPRRVDPLDQHLEGHVLVLERLEAAGAHPGEQVGEGGIAGQVDPQHQGVDEEADQLVEGGVAPPGDREAHRHVGAGADLRQQHRQGGLHHHEAGRVVLAGQPGDLLLQVRRPVDLDGRAALIGDLRVGPVGGQLKPLGHAGQRLLPVGELLGDAAAAVGQLAELVALPQGVVDVLHRQRLPVGGPPGGPAGVRHAQVAHQRSQRPAVRGDVVDHGDQHVFVLGDAEKRSAQRDLGRQVEGFGGGDVDGLAQPARRPPAGVDHPPAQIGPLGGEHHLLGCSLRRGEHRPQALVAGHHVGQRGAERVRVEPPVHPQRRGHVVDGGRSLQLVEEPQPALGERQRDHRRPGARHQRVQPARVLPDARRQLGDGGRLEDDAHRNAGVHGAVDRRDDAHRRDAVAAEVEEGVVDPDPLDAEHVGVDAGQDLLGGGGRRAIPGGGVFGRRQGAGVELAVDGHGQRVERHHRHRNHVGRQPLGQLGAGAGRVGGSGDVADEALVTGAVLAGDDDGLVHPVERGQRRAHLADLDAVAADLDLLVGAAEVLQLAVRAPAHQVAGAVHAGTRLAERARHEPRRGQPGPLPVAVAHAAAGHVQLADHACRYRAQPPVEHEQPGPGDGRADRGRTRTRAQRRARRGEDRGLGRAIDVDHHPPGRPAVHQFRRAGLRADHQRRGIQSLRREHPHRRRGLAQDGDLLGDQQGVEVHRRAGHRIGDHDEAPAVQQRAPDLPHREVEGVRMELRPHLVGRQFDADGLRVEQPGHVVVAHRNAFGHAGGAGGVDDVGDVFWCRRR